MRSLKDNAGLTPIIINSDYPNGKIIDDVPGIAGTAVVEEIYGDILVNIFKIINSTGVQTNGQPDNESTSYQFLAALQKFTNVLNDIERVVTLTSTTFAVDFDITLLPNKYVFIAKVIGAYGAGPYTFKGTSSSPSYSFSSPTGFSDGAEVLFVINQSGVLAFSLTAGNPPSSSATFNSGDIIGSDPFFALLLSSTPIPAMPKYLTMYVANGDSDNQNKLIQPVQYNATNKTITGMSSPTDFPSQVITIFWG